MLSARIRCGWLSAKGLEGAVRQAVGRSKRWNFCRPLVTVRASPAVSRLPVGATPSRTGFSCYRSGSFLSAVYTSRAIHRSSVLGADDVRVVNTPPFAESVTEGDVRWEKEVGDFVAEDDILAEIETDKTAIPVPSPVSGIVEELMVADGDTVTSGAQLCRIKVTAEGEAPAPAASQPDSPPAPAKEAMPPPAPAPPPPPAPTAAEEASPIPTTVPPIPPLPGQPLPSVPPPPPPPPPPTSAMAATPGSRSEKRVKMSRMRLRIAERLKEAQNVAAMLTTFNEVDMSNAMQLRQKYKEAFLKKHGVKFGYVSCFVKAASYALQDQPVVNAVIDGNEIVYRDYIDISVAVATPKGLVVPVLRNVETMKSYADVEREINELAVKARDGTLAVEDMDGGTFTISNGGVFGSLYGTPIINPPQSAILGMHAINDRPVAIDGKVEIRPMMYVALTYDHRLIDGREAVLFLRKIKSAVEDPNVMLMDI